MIALFHSFNKYCEAQSSEAFFSIFVTITYITPCTKLLHWKIYKVYMHIIFSYTENVHICFCSNSFKFNVILNFSDRSVKYSSTSIILINCVLDSMFSNTPTIYGMLNIFERNYVLPIIHSQQV